MVQSVAEGFKLHLVDDLVDESVLPSAQFLLYTRNREMGRVTRPELVS